jgi:hypothetical protein
MRKLVHQITSTFIAGGSAHVIIVSSDKIVDAALHHATDILVEHLEKNQIGYMPLLVSTVIQPESLDMVLGVCAKCDVPPDHLEKMRVPLKGKIALCVIVTKADEDSDKLMELH